MDGRPRLEFFGAGANGDEGHLEALHSGLELVLAERKRLALVPQLGLATAENVADEASVITSVDMQLRWYALQVRRLSLFVEAGAGLQYAGADSFPATGTHLNFRLRAGAGARWRLAPRWDLMGGYNWLHMSTANALEPNIGHDGPMYFLGASRSLRP